MPPSAEVYEYDGHSSGLSDALFLSFWVALPLEGVYGYVALLSDELYGSVVCICESNLFLMEPGRCNSHSLVEEVRCFSYNSLAQLEPSLSRSMKTNLQRLTRSSPSTSSSSPSPNRKPTPLNNAT